ncbi:MAG: hypothetical protein AAGC88_05935, partial [Bacteroidota bacterium]
IDPSLKEMAAHKLRNMEELFVKYLNIAMLKGKIKSSTPSEELALYLVTLWSGIQINRKLYPVQDGLASMLKTNLRILNFYQITTT